MRIGAMAGYKPRHKNQKPDISVRKYFEKVESRRFLSYGFEYQFKLLSAIISYHIESLEVKRVLDVASGIGAFSDLIKQFLQRPIFILADISRRPLIDSRSKIRLQADGNYLPIMNRSIDIILCRQGLHYMNVVEASSEFHRVLTPDGLLVLCNEWWLFGDETPEEMKYLLDYASSRNKPVHNLLSRQEIVRAVESAGFQILQRSDNFNTRIVPLNEWLTLYDAPEQRLSTTRNLFLEKKPSSFSVRGYPHLTNDTVTFVSKWIIIVARPAKD